ncbi:MAG TPA: branched-chain amino acid ABC transporter permease, partial [Atribacterota bacterium]|nr:branched-chain amino acid ABC transporter permease [Atribacterota bacterium]
KTGSSKHQAELLKVFNNFVLKYTALLYRSKYDLHDYDIRLFISLFIPDPEARRRLRRNQINHQTFKSVNETMRGIHYMINRYWEEEDVKQTVQMTFLHCVSKYKRKGAIPFSGFLYSYFYFAFFTLMVLTALAMYFIINSKFGYGIRSIKANEEAANSMGINTTYTKVSAWAVAALFTSMVGGLYGYWMSFIAPDEVFDLMFITNSIIMMLIGGAGTILGPIVGAFIIESVSEFAWSGFMEYHLAVLGIATIMIVFFVPKGVIGTITDKIRDRKIAANKKAEVVTNG